MYRVYDLAEKMVTRNLVLPLDLWKRLGLAAVLEGSQRAQFIRKVLERSCANGPAAPAPVRPVAVVSERPQASDRPRLIMPVDTDADPFIEVDGVRTYRSVDAARFEMTVMIMKQTQALAAAGEPLDNPHMEKSGSPDVESVADGSKRE